MENLVFADAWRAAGHTERPTFHGVPDDAMADDPSTALDEEHTFEPHFDRHVWIYRENPNGVFTPLNPALTCAAHALAHACAASCTAVAKISIPPATVPASAPQSGLSDPTGSP